MCKKKDISPLLCPSAIAVIGASDKFGAGSIVIENLMALGFKGEIIPVNPGYSRIFGIPCYPSLLDIPPEKKIDCVAILLNDKQVIPVLEQASTLGVRGAWAFASGFAETGEEGARLQEQLKDLCREKDIMFCGPNCVGYINLHDRVGTFSAPLSGTIQKGKVGAVAQSGSVILALANSNRGIGFSTLISSGNEAVLDTVDYFDYLLDDENTEVIIAFLEGIRRPSAFIKICKRAAGLGMPVIVVKLGKSDLAQKSVVSHTGSLAGSDRVHDALFRHIGVIRVNDLDQLLETAEAFMKCKNLLPKGNRIGAITVSGGEIGLMGDVSKDLSLTFPSLSSIAREKLKSILPSFASIGNPLDAWGKSDLRETYTACLDILTGEEGIDLIAVSQDAPPGMAEKQINQYADVAKAAVKAASSGKPVVAFSNVSGGLDPFIKDILEQGNIPFLQGTRESLVAMDKLIEYGAFLRRKAEDKGDEGRSPDNLGELIEDLRGNRRITPYAQGKKILESYGIQVAEEILAKSVDQALEGAQSIGYPVALKGQSSQITHRSEADLIRLNVQSKGELSAAFEQIKENTKKHSIDAVLEGILVQEMIPAEAVEVILGISRDPDFGPVVLFGLGGIFVELLQDTCLRFPPISNGDAHAMISGLKGKSVIYGYRGKEQADVESLAHAIVQVGRMAYDLREVIYSLDLNPLMVLPGTKGVRAVDIVMETSI